MNRARQIFMNTLRLRPKRHIDQIMGIETRGTELLHILRVQVKGYEGLIAQYHGGVRFGFANQVSIIPARDIWEKEKMPDVDPRYLTDWQRLCDIVAAARADHVDILILNW